jgi:putative endonuclease
VRQAWVYVMTKRPNGTLYVGVTSNLPRRIWEHRTGATEGFTKTYGLTRLVFVERHATVLDAIHREQNIKHWRRAWKVRLIVHRNPYWRDLYEQLI